MLRLGTVHKPVLAGETERRPPRPRPRLGGARREDLEVDPRAEVDAEPVVEGRRPEMDVEPVAEGERLEEPVVDGARHGTGLVHSS